jgi:hypothetical protein
MPAFCAEYWYATPLPSSHKLWQMDVAAGTITQQHNTGPLLHATHLHGHAGQTLGQRQAAAIPGLDIPCSSACKRHQLMPWPTPCTTISSGVLFVCNLTLHPHPVWVLAGYRAMWEVGYEYSLQG